MIAFLYKNVLLRRYIYRNSTSSFLLVFTGYFAYIEASRPRRSGDRAVLVSPIIRAEYGCLTFWYHMLGSHIGQLKLYLSTPVASNVIFERQGNKGRKWLLGKVDVNPAAGTLSGYKVSIAVFFYAIDKIIKQNYHNLIS